MSEVEIVELNVDEVLDQHIADLQEQWDNCMPGTEESDKIHKELMDALKLKSEYLKGYAESSKEKKANIRETIKFVVQSGLQLAGVMIPATLMVALIKSSEGGAYMDGTESKVFGWLYGMMKH